MSAIALAVLAVGCTRPARLNPGLTLNPSVCPPPGAPRLQFRSSYWLNLHNFLVKEAKRLRGIDDEGEGSRGNLLADTLGARALTPEEHRTWRGAVEFYASTVLRHQVAGGDSLVIRVNDRLADADGRLSLAGSGVDSAVADQLTKASPIYSAVWLPVHHRHNQTWIAAIRQLVERHGGCVFPHMERAFATSWSDQTIQADATVYANWFGAYSSVVNGPRVTISTNAVGNQEVYGLESVLHEAAHAAELLRVVDSAVAGSAERQGLTVSPELVHSILFFTTGALIRDLLPAYVPYAERFGIWTRNSATRGIQRALEEEWRPYLAGRTVLGKAVAAIVKKVGTRAPSTGGG